MFFFFFKQKTAYEMRISDWSSDVCSSDRRIGEFGHGCSPVRDVPITNSCPLLSRLPRRRGSRGRGLRCDAGSGRSEEHTSELQSLMRISYAVFCLKKKTKKTNTTYTHKI